MSEKPNMIPIDHDKPRKKFLGLTLPKTPEEVVKEYRDSQEKKQTSSPSPAPSPTPTENPESPKVEKLFPDEPHSQNVPDKNGLGYSKNEIADRAMPSYLHKELMKQGGYSTNAEVRDKAQKTIREQQEKDSRDMGGSRWSTEDITKVQSARSKDLGVLDEKTNLLPGKYPTQNQTIFSNSVRSQRKRTDQKSHDDHRSNNPSGWEPETPGKITPTTSFEFLGLFRLPGAPKIPTTPKVPATPKVDKDFREQIFKFPGAGKDYKPNPTMTPPPPTPAPSPTPTEKPEQQKAPLAPPPKQPQWPEPVKKTGDTDPARFRPPEPPKLIRDPITGMWKDAPKEEPKSKYESFQFPEGTKLAPPPVHPPKPNLGSVPRIGPTAEQYEEQQRLKREQQAKFPKPEYPKPPQDSAPTPSPSPTRLANFIPMQQPIPIPPIRPPVIPSIPDWIRRFPWKWPWNPNKPDPNKPDPNKPGPTPPETEDDIIRKKKEKQEEEERKRREEAGGGVPGAGGQTNTPPQPRPAEPVPADPVPDPKPPEKKDPPKEPKKPNPMDFAMMLPTQGSVSSFPSMVTGIPTHSAPSFEKTQLEINYYSELGF